MSVKWGIVGLGGMGDRFAAAVRATSRQRLAAVCAGRDGARGRAFAERHTASAFFTDFETLLADTGVDVVYIATPNALHASQTLLALEAGKHVLVEKPMALSLGDAREMEAAAVAHGRVLGVGFHLRHHPVHREARPPVALRRGRCAPLRRGAVGRRGCPRPTRHLADGSGGGGAREPRRSRCASRRPPAVDRRRGGD